MTSIFFLIETIQCNHYRGNYLKNKESLSKIFSEQLKSSLNSEHFKRKDGPHTWCISEFTDSEKIG